jgi:hypothetical protein
MRVDTLLHAGAGWVGALRLDLSQRVVGQIEPHCINAIWRQWVQTTDWRPRGELERLGFW